MSVYESLSVYGCACVSEVCVCVCVLCAVCERVHMHVNVWMCAHEGDCIIPGRRGSAAEREAADQDCG